MLYIYLLHFGKQFFHFHTLYPPQIIYVRLQYIFVFLLFKFNRGPHKMIQFQFVCLIFLSSLFKFFYFNFLCGMFKTTSLQIF